MKNLHKHHKWISFFVILLVALSMAVPVLADYLGPNRTVTTTISVCKFVLYRCAQQNNGNWDYKSVESWLCSNESKPWEAYSTNSPPCNSTNDGHKYYEQRDSTQTVTITHPPATISGSLQNCTLQNGWCVSPADLVLSANEPLAGYNITLIEGTLNGGSFACPNGATSCTVPFNEGENNFNYWALSSWGDSSAMGTSAARVDTVAPSVGLDISGTSGTNGWYVSPLTITATGADAMPGSGVASMLLSIDGGATWQPALILNEGVYNAAVSVADNAGNVSSSTTTLSVDTTTPSINMSVAGTLGKNGWYKSAIQVTAAASDATSGVASFEISADGAAYQAYTPIAFNDGPHTVRFKAVDAAGNVTETASQSFYVDTLAPTVNLPASWQLGTNVPYDVWDEGSCLAALRIVIEDEDEKFKKVAWDQNVSGCSFSEDIDWDGKWKDGTVAPPGTYLVWLKARDLAGNEQFYLGKVIVPEPNIIWSLLPTEEPAVVASPVPPAELFEPEALLPVTSPPTTGFGGETTQPGEATKQSLLLATGTAGAAAATTSPGVLWGPMAVAASAAAAAYAYDATRKRKGAERAEKRLTRSEKAERARAHEEKVQERKERRSWANPAKEKALLKEQEERDRAYQELLQQQAQAQAVSNARMAEKMTKFEKQEETAWVAAQAAIKAKQEEKKKAEEAAAKQAAQLQATAGYFSSEKQAQASVVTAPKEKSWWEKAASFVQEKIVQPAQNTWDKTKSFVKEKIIQPIVQSSFTKKVVLPVSAAALFLTGPIYAYNWYQQVAQNPHIFDAARTNAQNEWLQLLDLHPFTDENTDFGYLVTHPYEAFGIGYDTTQAIANSIAGYVDAAWQQSPVSQALSSTLKYIGDDVCSAVFNEAWSRRCGAVYYFGASVVENPADSAVWLGTKVIADPLAGFWKTGAFLVEHYNTPQMIFDLAQSIQENGWKEGLAQYGRDQWTLIKQTVVSDPQIQSFLILAAFLAVASLPIVGTALALGGGIYLVGGQAISTFAQIDQMIQSAATREEAMRYASSKEVRRNVTVILALAAILAFGTFRGLKDVNQFRAYQDSLPPSVRAGFYDLPFLRRLSVYNAAQKLGLAPDAQALSRYVDLAKVPDSLLNRITPQQGLNLVNGKVVQVDPALAVNLAAEIAKATGKDAWGSPFTGQIYFPESSPRAWAAESRFIEIIRQTPDQINGTEARALMQIISDEAWRGNRNSLQLGPFMVKDSGKVIPAAGVERGVYIQDALNNGKGFFDMGEVYYALRDALKEAGFDKPDQQLWPINEGTLQSAMESKVPLEFVYTDIDAEFNLYEGKPNAEVPIRVQELRWIIEHADEYDYIRDGNRWIWKPSP